MNATLVLQVLNVFLFQVEFPQCTGTNLYILCFLNVSSIASTVLSFLYKVGTVQCWRACMYA